MLFNHPEIQEISSAVGNAPLFSIGAARRKVLRLCGRLFEKEECRAESGGNPVAKKCAACGQILLHSHTSVSHPLWPNEKFCLSCQRLPRCVVCERRCGAQRIYLHQTKQIAGFSSVQVGRAVGRNPLSVCAFCTAAGLIPAGSAVAEGLVYKVLADLKHDPTTKMSFACDRLRVALVDIHRLSRPQKPPQSKDVDYLQPVEWGEALVFGRCECLEHPENVPKSEDARSIAVKGDARCERWRQRRGDADLRRCKELASRGMRSKLHGCIVEEVRKEPSSYQAGNIAARMPSGLFDDSVRVLSSGKAKIHSQDEFNRLAVILSHQSSPAPSVPRLPQNERAVPLSRDREWWITKGGRHTTFPRKNGGAGCAWPMRRHFEVPNPLDCSKPAWHTGSASAGSYVDTCAGVPPHVPTGPSSPALSGISEGRLQRVQRKGRVLKGLLIAEGLPEDVFVSTLAHELTHAYIFSKGWHLSSIAEEGICNAMCMYYVLKQRRCILKLIRYVNSGRTDAPGLYKLFENLFSIDLSKGPPQQRRSHYVDSELANAASPAGFKPWEMSAQDIHQIIVSRLILRERLCAYRLQRMMCADTVEYLAAVLILPLLLTKGLQSCLATFHKSAGSQSSVKTAARRPKSSYKSF